jgi:hypothetical protein
LTYKQRLLTILFLIILSSSIYGQLIPQEIISSMMRGINMGNTLEPPTEGGWNNGPAQQYYFEDYKNAGFQVVRIPVRWDKHTGSNPPYTIDGGWLNRVEQVVDWALDQDLFVIMNAHHEDWFFEDYNLHKARFDSIWSQIASRFQNKSDSLFFEMVNEPTVEGDVGPTVDEVDELNNRLISIIRKTNPTRIIIFSGNGWSNLEQLQQAAIPNDDYIMAYYHSYDPYEFGINGSSNLSEADIQYIRNKFKSAGNWSKEKNVPIMISEFGAPSSCDYNERMLFYATYVEEALKNGIAFMAWDNGGDFRIYKRSARDWEDMKDILIYFSPESPTNLHGASSDSTITLSWFNRTTDNDSIFIQRKTINSDFRTIAKLPNDIYTYSDTGLSPGEYYYRVISHFSDTTDIYSYPIKNTVTETVIRSPYNGKPFDLSAKIEAEEFDEGTDGLTYHDNDVTNKGSASSFRNTSVDIYNTSDTDDGYHIGSIKTGEWLEYTINIEETSEYLFEVRVASNYNTGKLNLRLDGKIILRSFTIPNTGGWNTWQTLTETTRSMDAGEHILRVEITGDNFNLNWFRFSQKTTVDEKKQHVKKYHLSQNYPNPFNPTTMINYQLPMDSYVLLEVYDIQGEKVTTLVSEQQSVGNYSINFDAKNLSSGVYIYTLESNGLSLTKKMILMK